MADLVSAPAMISQAYPLLSSIHSPADLKKLSLHELELVAAECRKR